MVTAITALGITSSKRPFKHVRALEVQHSPFIEAVMEVQGWIVRVVAMHASSPISYGDFQKRNRQLDELANYLAKGGPATIGTAALIDPRQLAQSHPRA